MPYIPRNTLRLEPLRDDNGKLVINGKGEQVYRLFGFVGGTKIRKQGPDLNVLTAEKKALEDAAEVDAKKRNAALDYHQTWLTKDQLHDAEAAFRLLPSGRALLECVECANRVLGKCEPVLCDVAFESYKKNMVDRRLELKSVNEAQAKIRKFLDEKKPKYLHDVTPAMVNDWCYEKELSAYSQLGRASVLHAFFNFCTKPAQLYIKTSPVQIDITEMRKRARPTTEPEIHTPEQAQRLLDVVCETGHAGTVLFTIIGYFCFLRPSEILRLTPDQFYMRDKDGKKSITLHLRGKKIGSPWRDVPIPDHLVGLVVDCLNAGAFKTRTDKKTKKEIQRFSFSELGWKRARARAGFMTVGPNPDRPDRVLISDSDWTQDVMRHTGMSYLFQETGDEVLVTRRAGNSKTVAFRHYLRRAEPDAFERFNKITGTLGKQIAQEPAQNVA